MDDQRADRESGTGVAAKPLNRFQFGVRLMLLVVALFCVVCATYWARSEVRRQESKYELDRNISRLKDELHYLESDPQEKATVATIKAEIAELEKQQRARNEK